MGLTVVEIDVTVPSSTGTVTCTPPSQAQFILAIPTISTSGSAVSDAAIGFGMCDPSLNQVGFFARAKNGSTSTLAAYKRQNITSIITAVNDSGTVIYEAKVTAIGSTT